MRSYFLAALYIGETQMQLKVRICQHKGISYRIGVPYSAPSHSSIRDCSIPVPSNSVRDDDEEESTFWSVDRNTRDLV